MAAFGPRMAFRAMGTGAGIAAILYTLYHYSKRLCKNWERRVANEHKCENNRATSLPKIELNSQQLTHLNSNNLDVISEEFDEEDQELEEPIDGQHQVRKASLVSSCSVNRHNPKPFLA